LGKIAKENPKIRFTLKLEDLSLPLIEAGWLMHGFKAAPWVKQSHRDCNRTLRKFVEE